MEMGNSLYHKSDFIISLTREKVKLTFLDKIKNIIFFWKPKKLGQETTVYILKNRYGKPTTFKINY